MKRLLNSRPVEQALRGAALVVTDRRWAAPLSAAALGFGVFAGVAIGPGTAGSLATGAQQIIEIPSPGGAEGQSGGGGGGVASTESAGPSPDGGGGGGFEEEALPSVPLAAETVEPLPAPTTGPAAKPTPPSEEGGDETEKPEGQDFEGTVAAAAPAAGGYALAIKGGELVSVHAVELPEPGTKLSASLRPLANGTFAEADEPEEEKKKATEVTFRGSVSFVDSDQAAPAYAVSGRGSSLLVHVEPDPGGAVPELPAVGSYVTVTARIEAPEAPEGISNPKTDSILVQRKVEVDSIPPSTYLELAGMVKEVLPDGHLLFSADWAGESESSLALAVPANIDVKELKLGDSYLATAEVAEDGSLSLKGIASDERRKGADDASSAQGDLAR
jgi:hypothetical protein